MHFVPDTYAGRRPYYRPSLVRTHKSFLARTDVNYFGQPATANRVMPSQTIPHLTTSPYPQDRVQGATELTRTVRRRKFGHRVDEVDGFGYPLAD